MEDFNMKTALPAIIGLILLIVGLLVPKVMLSGTEADYKKVNSTYDDLQNDYEVKRSSLKSANDLRASNYEKISVVATRHNTDDELFANFMTSVCDWTSLDTYNAKRKEIVNSYHPDDNFIKVFFPEVVNEETTEEQSKETKSEAKGKKKKKKAEAEEAPVETVVKNINRIDDGKAKVEFVGLDSYLIAQQNEDYMYFTKVAIKCTENGTATTRVFSVIYTIGADKRVSKLECTL